MRVSQEDFLGRVRKRRLALEVSPTLSGPARRKIKAPFRLKLRLEPPSRLMDCSLRKDPDDLPFPGARGRGSEVRYRGLTACQCVSLGFRSGEHLHQLRVI